MEPAVQKGSVEGVFENDWRIDGEARPHISKYLKGMVDETAIKALRVAEIEKLKNYFSKLNDKNPSVDRKLQIKILEILEEG
jgi:hypothetical protein